MVPDTMLLTLACVLGPTQQGEKSAPVKAEASSLRLVTTIAMPGVEGRIDHMAFDPYPGTVLVAALENGTLELLDLPTKKALYPSPEPEQPKGVVYIEHLDLFVVTDGKLGRVWRLEMPFALDPDTRSPDATPNAKRGVVGPDPDNIRFLPKKAILLVGYGDGGLGYLDLREFQLRHTIDLGAHPESFQVNAAETRAWVNVPGKSSIAVVDLDEKKVERWIEVKSARKNYPMALFESEKRVLVGCRDPGRLLVFDTETDALTAELPLSGDVDDIFVDAARGLVYASCGEGFVDVFERTGPGTWKPKEKVATRTGARTCLFVPDRKQLFVAVPKRGDEPAEVRIFSTVP